MNFIKFVIGCIIGIMGFATIGLSSDLTVPLRPDEVQPSNLKGYWKLTETSGTRSDSSGNGNHLTDNNTVTYSSDNYWALAENSAVFASANTEYLSITDGSQVGLDITGSLSTSMWIKVTSLSTIRTIFAKYDAGTSQRAYLLYITSTGAIEFSISSNGTSDVTAIAPAGTIVINKWYHVSCIFNSSTQQAYILINGNLVPNSSNNPKAMGFSSIFNSSASFLIGAYLSSGTPTLPFDGYIKDFAIWSTALTPQEIKSLAMGTDPVKYYYRPDNTALPSPTAYWKLNEISNGSGAVSRLDSSGNGHTLTDNNTVATSGGYFEGTSADFESSNSEYLSHADNDDFDMSASASDAFSFTTWIKHESLGINQYYATKNSVTGYAFFTVSTGVTRLYLNGTEINTATGVVKVNTWHHLTFIYDRPNNLGKIYIDGILKASSSVVSLSNNATSFRLGADETGANQFDGIMSDTAWWKGTALTDAQIASLAAGLPIQQSGIVSYWKLDESSGNAIDSKGSNTLTDNNTVGSATGIVGNARDFESSNSEYFSISHASQTGLDIASDMTLSGWINLESNTGLSQLIMAKDSVTDGYGMVVSSALKGYAFIGSNGALGSTTLPTSAWVYITATYDNSFNRIYINSALDGSTANTTNPSTASDPFYMGVASPSLALYFDGLMDELVIAQRYFREEEIKTSYVKGLNAKELTSSEVQTLTGRRRLVVTGE